MEIRYLIFLGKNLERSPKPRPKRCGPIITNNLAICDDFCLIVDSC